MLKVIDIALEEVGYLEKASPSELDDKTANVGSGNFTKYARDLDTIPGFYNGKKQGYAWCAVFVDWCEVQAYGVAKAKALLHLPENSLGASCTYASNYFKSAGQFYKSAPQVGDQIFFGTEGNVYHTGLVYKVDSSKVYTVEGNTSGASGVVANGGGVFRKSYSLSYAKIYGYGRPNYAIVVPDPETETVDITMDVLKKGSLGTEVKTLQRLLMSYGYSMSPYGVDGDFGSLTDKRVREYQKKQGLDVDGVVGKQTWTKLLKG